MIYETRINLRNKTKEELIMFVNEGLETIKKYQAELEKKDKVINEMAIYLADIDFDECCAEIPEPCLCCSWEDYEPHINCIKRYFTNKVEKNK